MHSSEDRHEYHDERVSTEPQRRVLDAMSEDLVRKLHAMVAEQEARAREFAAHQHSLSSLPNLQQTFPLPESPAISPMPEQLPRPGTITNGPRIPKRLHPRKETQQAHSPTPDWDAAFNPPSAPSKQNKESGIGAGTIITCIIIFLIIMRSCS